MMQFAGVDYGARYAGTTVVCYSQDGRLFFRQSEKGEDADTLIIETAKNLKIKSLYLDAPLSLPSAFLGIGQNFHYRQCDIELNAMSPMFLGGLTARACHLKFLLGINHVTLYEVYPAALAKSLNDLSVHYNKKQKTSLNNFIESFLLVSPLRPVTHPENWHQVDSWLAWYSGWRHINNIHTSFGINDEGLIIV
jgi:uncharacterized protein